MEAVTPAEVESRLAWLTDQIDQGVAIVSEREAEWKRLAREYDREYARAFLAAEGPQTEKKYHAELACAQKRIELEVA